MLRLAYGPLVIAVESPDPAPLAWLREFLGDAFEAPSPSAPPDHTVRLGLGPLGPDPLGPAEEVDCFSLDGSFVRLPARRAPDGSLAIRDDEEGVRYAVRGPDAAILAPADGPALRLALLRVVRELATADALRRGHLHLHAAAVAAGEQVVAIAGRRGSGKTTLLLHLLLGGRVRYVTNDRLLVDARREPPLARGMPTIVSLREETLARFPAVAERLRGSGYARERTLAEARGPSRPKISPAQLRALAGVGERGGGPLRAAVFPSVRDSERFEVRLLPSREAAERLRRALFLAALPERPAAAFAGATQPRDGPALDRLCRELAARIRCLDVRLGPRAYEAPAVGDAILENL
jgi:hypothetical protein